MTKRRIRPAVAVILTSITLTFAAYTYAMVGGTAASVQDPYHWDGKDGLVVVLDGTESEEPACYVRSNGSREEISGPHRHRFLDVTRTQIDPINSPATVTCPQGRIFTGFSGFIVHKYYLPMVAFLPTLVISAGLHIRRQNKTKEFNPHDIQMRR